ncbi:hypothetical protein [Aeromonas phage PVN04]|nr:hypothetical protein [Aeromonas phage PVN04]
MEKRPLFRGYWAQDASPDDIGDADVYIPTNPVYPEQVPEQYTAGWFVSPGDEEVKQPHQWNNAWLQSIDWQLWSWYIGRSTWHPELTYAHGAVVYVDGKRYIAASENKGVEPTANPVIWEAAAFHTKSEMDSGYNSTNKKYTDHETRRDNPHGVTYEDVGGYSKQQIDDLVKAEQTDVDNHVKNTSDPHEVTPEQLNTLPTSGGAFSEAVSLLKMVFGAGGEIRRLSDGFELYIPDNGGARFGIHTKTKEAQLNGEPMLTDVNYGRIRQRNAWKFVAPSADVHIPLSSDLNGYNSSFGGVEYESTAEIHYTDKSGNAQVAAPGYPGFGKFGLELRAGTNQSLVAPFPANGVQGTVFGVLDGLPAVGVGPLNQSNLLEYFPTGTALRDLRVWLHVLTPYQIAALGVNA